MAAIQSTEPLLSSQEGQEEGQRGLERLANDTHKDERGWLRIDDIDKQQPWLSYVVASFWFALTAGFAHWIELYVNHAGGAPPVSKHLSSYVVFLAITSCLRNIAGVTLSAILFGGGMVGIGWSLVQKHGGAHVNLSAQSIHCCWQWYHYVLFGLAGLAIVVGVSFRVRALRAHISCREALQRLDVQLSVAGVSSMLIVAKLFHAGFHIHHWFIGLLLTLAATGWDSTAGRVVQAFGFGLFLHGASAWGIGDLFLAKASPTAMPTVTVTALLTTTIPFLAVLAIRLVCSAWHRFAKV